MSKVEFVYGKGGKKVMMQRRYAETLAKLGHGTFAEGGYQDKMLTSNRAIPTPRVAELDDDTPEDGPLVSDAVEKFAVEHGVDLASVKGTGLNGRIKKSDVEAVIQARDLV